MESTSKPISKSAYESKKRSVKWMADTVERDIKEAHENLNNIFIYAREIKEYLAELPSIVHSATVQLKQLEEMKDDLLRHKT